MIAEASGSFPDYFPCPAEEGHRCVDGSTDDQWECPECGRSGGAEEYKRLSNELAARQDQPLPLRFNADQDEASAQATQLALDRAALPQAISIEEFLARKLPDRKWLATGLLQEKDTIMIHGWRGFGKSHFAAGLAYGLASGTDFLKYKIAEPVGVLYVDGEMPQEDLQQRFSAIEHSSTSRTTAPLFFLPRDMAEVPFPSLATHEGQRMVEVNLKPGIKVVILDSFSTLCQSEERENDSGSWAGMQEWLLTLRSQGLTVVLVHHDGKNREQRGTSARETILSQVVQLVQPEDYDPSQGARFQVHLRKARGVRGADAAPFEAWLESTPDGRQVWTVRPLEGIEDRIRAAQEAGIRSCRKIEAATGISKSTVDRYLRTMKDS